MAFDVPAVGYWLTGKPHSDSGPVKVIQSYELIALEASILPTELHNEIFFITKNI